MANENQTVQVLDRSSRSTRGKRLSKLLHEETQADEEFWGQEAFQEVAEDAEYEAEDDVVDEFDSDFDEDETNAEEEAPQEEVERVKRKKLLPPGSKFLKKQKKKDTTVKSKGLDAIEAAVAAAVLANEDEQGAVQPHKPIEEGTDVSESYADIEGEKTVRKSTRTAVVIRQAEREALRAAMEATTIKPVKKKREGEKRISQEDMLLEAAQTEMLNQQHLERMLAREEEVKQKAIIHKTKYDGPQIRFYSRDGENLFEFMGDVSEWQEVFGQPKQVPKHPRVCAVTGLPAKYLDPLTGLPYATIEAFKMIRERVAEVDSTRSVSTPGKNFRSARSVSGGSPCHSSARKARSLLHSSPHGRLHGRFSGEKARVPGHRLKRHLEAPDDLEASPANDRLTDINSQHLLDGNLALEPRQSGTISEITQSILSVENRLQTNYHSNALTAPLESQSEHIWVEIPPPMEVPCEDTYMLDDLTSLDFGPILATQHYFTCPPQRDDDLDIDGHNCEGMSLPLDVLPMPQEFSSVPL